MATSLLFEIFLRKAIVQHLQLLDLLLGDKSRFVDLGDEVGELVLRGKREGSGSSMILIYP